MASELKQAGRVCMRLHMHMHMHRSDLGLAANKLKMLFFCR